MASTDTVTLQRVGSQGRHGSSGSLCGECDRSKTRLGASACLFNATLDGACLFCDLGSIKAYAACVLRRDDYVKIGDLISRYRDVL